MKVLVFATFTDIMGTNCRSQSKEKESPKETLLNQSHRGINAAWKWK